MIRRIAFALSVLAATIYWANCDVFFPVNPPPPAPNTRFAGCFEGQISDPAGAGPVTLVLEASRDDPSFTGCITLFRDQATVNGMVVGELVESDAPEEARLTVTSSMYPTFELLALRSPTGAVDATTLTLTTESGIPFRQATSLPRCPPPRPTAFSCRDLGFQIPFLPGGGPP